eukprot:Nitzschia sp. Nitz4//scaffold128_size63911//49765//50352//NITZ4_006228-RA/size63911-processed-gene-0.120-mRNA-1//1//CDS//3329534859//6381//frame0
MSTSSGPAAAASFRQAKHTLLRILCKDQPVASYSHENGAQWTFGELKKLYLGRLHEIHPDKLGGSFQPRDQIDALKAEFRELRDAWTNYERVALPTLGGGKEAASFTQFAVGCSFADNDQERDLRNEITDQACRGWFTSGLLAEESSSASSSSSGSGVKPVSLIDDSLFVQEESQEEKVVSKPTTRRKTLIPGLK